MSTYRRINVSVGGDVTVVTFRDRKITGDMNVQELGQELFRLVEGERKEKLLRQSLS